MLPPAGRSRIFLSRFDHLVLALRYAALGGDPLAGFPHHERIRRLKSSDISAMLIEQPFKISW
ncbi:hypothetical protein [Mesorhizobium sp. NPDC059025]|uniref:hypothetical protein n=1 Tax=unclassified Mesorhizobium TaxID=325217 RepID=UPI00367EAF49